jgi:tetratricopeptide (TPR) repeat protein
MAAETEEMEISKAKALVEDLYMYSRRYFDTHGIDGAEEKETNVQVKLQDTLHQLKSMEGALPTWLYQYLRGKSLNVLSSHSKEAERLLSQAVKQNPSLVDGWNCLGESYWKGGNVTQAHHCFTGALGHEVNKESLRNLSMVLRQIGKDQTKRQANIKESLEKAKEAVTLDVTDGTSWMVLGNAYLAVYFTVEQDPKLLQQANSAYVQAEKDPITVNNPDLHFNMATLHLYEECYPSTITHLEQAARLDPAWSTPLIKLKSLKDFLQTFNSLIASRGKLRPKRLSSIQEKIRQALGGGSTPSSDEGIIASIRTLRESSADDDGSSGAVLTAGVATCITTPDKVPLGCVLIDHEGDSIGCTIYNLLDTFQFTAGDVLVIPRPLLTHVHVPQLGVQYDNIRIIKPQELTVNGKTIPADKLSYSTAEVTAFS